RRVPRRHRPQPRPLVRRVRREAGPEAGARAGRPRARLVRIGPDLRDCRAVLILSATLVAAPVILDRAVSGPATPIRYFAPDSFYYHTVALNVAEKGTVSYDGTHPTNGFHPAWQASLAALAASNRILGGDRGSYLELALGADVAIVCAAVVLLGAAVRRARGSLNECFVLLPVGAYA